MGLFDNLISGVVKGITSADPAAIPGLAAQYLAKTELRDTNGLIERLRQGGLEREVQSWLGGGPNLPVSVEQLRAALGEDVIQQLVAATGVPADKLLPLVASYMPRTVDAMSTNGTLATRSPPA